MQRLGATGHLGRSRPATEMLTRKRLLALIAGRVVFMLLLALFLMLFNRGQVTSLASPAMRLLSGAFFATLLLSGIYTLLSFKLGRGLYWLAFVQIQLDLVLWAVLILVTGGVSSTFTFLFHISIVIAAVFLGDRGVIFTLVLSVTCYLIVVVAGLLDWFPALGSVLGSTVQPGIGDLVISLTLDIGSMILVALLGWVLALQVTRAGESLERTQEIFEDLHRLNQAIVSFLPSGLITTDASGKIRSINPAAGIILHAGSSEVIGKSLEQVLGDSLPLAEKATGSAEMTISCDGREIRLELATSPLWDGAGNVMGSVVHVMDVTEDRRMRQKLGEFDKYRAMGDLAVGLAHEIRNPLGSISGSIELVTESDRLAREDRRLLEIVLRETDKIGRLVTSLFNLARPPDPIIDAVEVRSLVQDVADLFARDPEVRGIRIETDVPEGLLMLADRDQLGQVIMNLLKNAAEASRDRGTMIRIEGRMEQASTCTLRVFDSGRGVDPDLIDRIFDPYFTTKGYGLGVGLALCREIIDRHGGTVTMENRPDGGAVATIRLPSPRERAFRLADF